MGSPVETTWDHRHLDLVKSNKTQEAPSLGVETAALTFLQQTIDAVRIGRAAMNFCPSPSGCHNGP